MDILLYFLTNVLKIPSLSMIFDIGLWGIRSVTSKKIPIPVLLGFFSKYMLVLNFVKVSYDFSHVFIYNSA